MFETTDEQIHTDGKDQENPFSRQVAKIAKKPQRKRFISLLISIHSFQRREKCQDEKFSMKQDSVCPKPIAL